MLLDTLKTCWKKTAKRPEPKKRLAKAEATRGPSHRFWDESRKHPDATCQAAEPQSRVHFKHNVASPSF